MNQQLGKNISNFILFKLKGVNCFFLYFFQVMTSTEVLYFENFYEYGESIPMRVMTSGSLNYCFSVSVARSNHHQ